MADKLSPCSLLEFIYGGSNWLELVSLAVKLAVETRLYCLNSVTVSGNRRKPIKFGLNRVLIGIKWNPTDVKANTVLKDKKSKLNSIILELKKAKNDQFENLN